MVSDADTGKGKSGRRVSLSSKTDKGTTSFANKTMQKFGDQDVDLAKCGIGFTCRKGLKPESPNQDSWFVLKMDSFSLYGVFDGHGQKGHDVSNFAMDMLPKCIIKDERCFTTRDWGPILIEAFKKTQNFITVSDKGKALQAQMSGTTATVAIHDHADNSVTIGHDEKARIEKSGGRVVFDGYANYRVYAKNARYPGLNMSRCLGDLLGHAECGMSCEPEINRVKFEPDKQYILLLCSDAKEFISAQEAVDTVSKFSAGKACKAADELAKEAWDRWIKEEGGSVATWSQVKDVLGLKLRISPQSAMGQEYSVEVRDFGKGEQQFLFTMVGKWLCYIPVTVILSGQTTALKLLFSGPGVSGTYRNTWPGWYNVGGYVLDSGGVMLSGYDGKRQAYDTAGLVGVRFEDGECASIHSSESEQRNKDIAGGFLEFELLSQFRNRPLLSVVNSCMGSDRENDGHLENGVAQHLLIGFAGNFEDGLNWVLFRLQNHSAHSEFTYAFGTQNKTNPGFAGRVYIYGVQHAVESAGMWKSVTRPCAIDSEGCITSHNFPRFYGSQDSVKTLQKNECRQRQKFVGRTLSTRPTVALMGHKESRHINGSFGGQIIRSPRVAGVFVHRGLHLRRFSKDTHRMCWWVCLRLSLQDSAWFAVPQAGNPCEGGAQRLRRRPESMILTRMDLTSPNSQTTV
eukprot:g2923.t1